MKHGPENAPAPDDAPLASCATWRVRRRGGLAAEAHARGVQGVLNVVLKTGASSLLVRDALRRPLAELELGAVSAGLRRSTPAVLQARPAVSLCRPLAGGSCRHARVTATAWKPAQMASRP